MAFTFNGATKTITLSSGTVTMGVRDLWSRWVDWWVTGDNSKYPIAFEQVGGNDIDLSAGTSIPIYAFLQNGWKIKPQEANHTLNVNDGILLVAGGGDPFINTTGSYIVRINYSQPVQAITVATGGGSGGGATPAEIWSYATRTLTESAGLTPAQDEKLMSLTNVGGGFSINYQAINSHTTNKINELKDSIKIPTPDLAPIEQKLNDIDSHIELAKEETIDRIEEAEIDLRKDVNRTKTEIKDDNVKTRNLVRQKSEKVVKYAEEQLDRQEKLETMIEGEAEEIETLIEQNIDFEADEIEKEINQQIDREIEEIESNLPNNGNDNGSES